MLVREARNAGKAALRRPTRPAIANPNNRVPFRTPKSERRPPWFIMKPAA